jgi:hypothetical protein
MRVPAQSAKVPYDNVIDASERVGYTSDVIRASRKQVTRTLTYEALATDVRGREGLPVFLVELPVVVGVGRDDAVEEPGNSPSLVCVSAAST